MEPLSILAGVTGVVGFTAQAIKLVKGHIDSAKHASKTVKDLLEKIGTLYSTLSQLEKYLESDAVKAIKFEADSVLASTVDTCKLRVNELLAKLKASPRARLSRLTWPLKEEENNKAIRELRAASQLIHFTLSVNNRYSPSRFLSSSNRPGFLTYLHYPTSKVSPVPTLLGLLP